MVASPQEIVKGIFEAEVVRCGSCGCLMVADHDNVNLCSVCEFQEEDLWMIPESTEKES